MLATGEPPAIVSIHSFTAVLRGAARPWKVGILWDRDGRIPKPLIEALVAEPDLAAAEVGDNEPYDGALAGIQKDWGSAPPRPAERVGSKTWVAASRFILPLWGSVLDIFSPLPRGKACPATFARHGR